MMVFKVIFDFFFFIFIFDIVLTYFLYHNCIIIIVRTRGKALSKVIVSSITMLPSMLLPCIKMLLD